MVAILVPCTWAADRPNFLVILADDLGFSDVGCCGGEIPTPHLDHLAAQGLRYAQFYNTARCWPTRAALLTGYYAQQIGRDALPEMAGGAGGQRPPWAQLLPALLRPLGYRSYHSGKWHVDGGPLQNSFDRSYSLNDHDRYFSTAQPYRGRTATSTGRTRQRLLHDDRDYRSCPAVSAATRRGIPRSTVLSVCRLQLSALSPAGAARGHREISRSLCRGLGHNSC